MNDVTSAVSSDPITVESFPDTRDIPLERLPGDTDVQRMATRALDNTREPSRVRVAAFNSGI